MWLGRDRRGRLTIPDLAFLLFSLAALAALWPVLNDGLQSNAAEISTGEGYVFTLWLPLAICIMLAMAWRAAVGGGPA